jgi:hypothetical protein
MFAHLVKKEFMSN